MAEQFIPEEAYRVEQKEEESLPSKEVLKIDNIEITLPEKPWMPTHSGVELRVTNLAGDNLAAREQTESGKMMAELKGAGQVAIIAAEAASKVITENGYAGNQFDKSYLHLNANWSLDQALPVEERDEVMDFGAVSPGKWPGPRQSQTVPSPNAHPHVQILKINEPGGSHDLDIPISGKYHSEHPRGRQTDEEIQALKELLEQKLTPLIENLQGETLRI